MQTSFRAELRAAVAKNPVVLGWTRRAYVGLGFGEKNESDYLFDLARTLKDVFVLQVGANDGKRHDCLGSFIRNYRWKGLLLEPLQDVFADLTRNYENTSNVVLINAALADRDGEMTFYRVKPAPEVPDNCHELGSFYREVVEKHTSVFSEISDYIVPETITAVSFSTLVEQQKVEKISAVIIDTEGYDFQVLKLIDFKRFQPRLVIYEHMHLSPEDQEAAKRHLTSLGYEVHPMTRVNCNTAAVYRGSSLPKAG